MDEEHRRYGLEIYIFPIPLLFLPFLLSTQFLFSFFFVASVFDADLTQHEEVGGNKMLIPFQANAIRLYADTPIESFN